MKKYCLGLIFDTEMTKVLLIQMQKLFVGKWNGVGGKIEQDETPIIAMIRELREETTIDIECIDKLHELLSITLPSGDLLYVYYSRLYSRYNDKFLNMYPKEKGPEGHNLDWYSLDYLRDVTNDTLAGNGNISYFVNLALLDCKERMV